MSTPTTLIIARHGEARCNRDQVIGGPKGCRGLTAHGRAQIGRLGQHLHDQHVQLAALYTSPLRRALESAAIISNATGLPITVNDDLREQDPGPADGCNWSEVIKSFGGIPALEPDRPYAPGGETWRAYLNRAATTLSSIISQHSNQAVIVVGHGETADAAFHHFLRLPVTSRSYASHALHNAAMSIWQQAPLAWTQPEAGQRWTLVAHNVNIHSLQ
ncbi:MAG: histidine phosphatase family protein [Stackebrandtia sp.]